MTHDHAQAFASWVAPLSQGSAPLRHPRGTHGPFPYHGLRRLYISPLQRRHLYHNEYRVCWMGRGYVGLGDGICQIFDLWRAACGMARSMGHAGMQIGGRLQLAAPRFSSSLAPLPPAVTGAPLPQRRKIDTFADRRRRHGTGCWAPGRRRHRLRQRCPPAKIRKGQMGGGALSRASRGLCQGRLVGPQPLLQRLQVKERGQALDWQR